MSPRIALNKIYHEPSRLTIMSTLCGASRTMSFNALKDECKLTDGNLSRHLRTLEEAAAVMIRKTFSGNKPQTTIRITDLGRETFVEYLKSLEQVLIRAAEAITDERKVPACSLFWDADLALEQTMNKN